MGVNYIPGFSGNSSSTPDATDKLLSQIANLREQYDESLRALQTFGNQLASYSIIPIDFVPMSQADIMAAVRAKEVERENTRNTILAEADRLMDSPEQEKLDFIKGKLTANAMGLHLLYSGEESIVNRIKLNDDSKQCLIEFVIINYREVNKNRSEPSFNFYSHVKAYLSELYEKQQIARFMSTAELVDEQFIDGLKVIIGPDLFANFIGHLFERADDSIYRYALKILQKDADQLIHMFHHNLQGPKFSLLHFREFVQQYSPEDKRQTNMVHVDRLCSEYFHLSFLNDANDSLETRLSIAEKAFSIVPHLLAGHLCYFFSDLEIATDMQAEGPISKLFQRCLEQVRGADTTIHLGYLKMYFDRYISEKLQNTAASSTQPSTGYTESPIDGHLFIHIGDDIEGDHVFMVRREYDERLKSPHQFKDGVEKGNISLKLDEIEPANELSPTIETFKNDCELSLFRKLGFKWVDNGNGTFVVLPEPSALEKRYAKLKLLSEFSNLSETLRISRTPGTADTLSFIKAFKTHDFTVSLGREFFHDTGSHERAVLKMKLDGQAYSQLRARVDMVTDEILDVCEHASAKSSSQKTHDLCVFLIESAGALYDAGSTSTIERWHRNLDGWEDTGLITAMWAPGSIWRKGIRAQLPNEKEYTAEKISAFWRKHRDSFRNLSDR